MERLYYIPLWFVKYSIGLELIFAIVTLLIAIFAFKIYNLTAQRQLKLFSLGFFATALSYIIWFTLNSFALARLNDQTSMLLIDQTSDIVNLAAYGHVILYLTGLAILVYTTLKSESLRTLTLLIAMSIIPIFVTCNTALLFNVIAAIYLAYLVIHYAAEYKEKRIQNTLYILTAFILLLTGTIELLFSTGHYLNFVIAHICILGSYLLLLASLARIYLSNGAKKKQT